MFSHAFAKIDNKMDVIFFLQLNECVEISCPWAQLDNYLITELENLPSLTNEQILLKAKEKHRNNFHQEIIIKPFIFETKIKNK